MKKITALFLCLVFCLSLVCCGKSEEKKETVKKNGVDIEQLAEKGAMTDCEYRLGDHEEKVYQRTMGKSGERGDDAVSGFSDVNATQFETDRYSVISTPDFGYYFSLHRSFLLCIVSYGDAYGFQHGTVITELQKAMEDKGYTTTESELSADEAFFLYGSVPRTKLEYKFGDNTVMFVFEENALCATAIITEEKE